MIGHSFQATGKNLLKTPAAAGPSRQELAERATDLENVLSDFSVNGSIGDSRYGPVATASLNPAQAQNRNVIALADDIARSMSAVSVRVAVVPGRMSSALNCRMRPADGPARRNSRHGIWQEDESDLPMA